ncbi:fimbrial chaperone [Lelliottia sp. RWM.1]|uniref:fimbrial chaperone n=1 Tax=Lelliottia sp. RWM.1 TaxID=2663242 RepID=UPI00193CAD8E|nr:fimbrial chaperone [Lelliottia sp. RWM.1]
MRLRNAKISNGMKTLVFMLGCIITAQANADIVISGTRVIYPESAKDVIVNLENKGNHPLLVQSWLDDGRDTVDPQELKLPFVITPPVTRVDARKGQSIRVTWLGTSMPQDRESLYWFNVLEVPPKAQSEENQNMLQLAFRTRIKLFFRPNGLKGTPEEAAKNLKWSQQKNADGLVLVAKNDAVYNVSLASAEFEVNGKKYEVESHSVKPLSSEVMKVKGLSNITSGKVKYSSINDFGGMEEHNFPVN